MTKSPKPLSLTAERFDYPVIIQSLSLTILEPQICISGKRTRSCFSPRSVFGPQTHSPIIRHRTGENNVAALTSNGEAALVFYCETWLLASKPPGRALRSPGRPFARQTHTRMDNATNRPAAKLTIVSSMQWLYGPTWGATLVRCDRQSVEHRKAKKLCISVAQMRARQLELAEVVRRNLEHPAVSAYHLLVNDASQVQEFFRRLPHRSGGRAGLKLIDMGHTLPTFATYIGYVSTTLPNQPVVILNQDIFLEGRQWLSLFVPPNQAFALSRYHKRQYAYDTAVSGRALSAAVPSSGNGGNATCFGSNQVRQFSRHGCLCRMSRVVSFSEQTTCTQKR